MATTFEDYNAPATYQFSFPSIQESDIKVSVDGDVKTSGTHYNINDYSTTGGGTVVFIDNSSSGGTNHTPSNPSSVRIFRDTDVDSAKATYTAGSSVKAADLNANHQQLMFAAQEEQNQTIDTSDIKDGAVTTAKIADLNVTTGKVANRSITKDKIAINTITEDEINDNAVGGGELKDGAVDTQHVQTDAITKVKIGEARLKTLADMQSGTASKLAASTTLTADIADLNQIDGMQKATSITNDDTKFPTSGAVISYVTAQIDALDAFKILSNEVSFPNTQFDSGVVISIGDAGGIVINGSGTSTTARTLNGTTVTINNFPTSLNNETLASGVGLLVSSTGSGQIYNYHKLLATENDVKQLSDDINDFNARYRTGTSTPTTNNDAGDLFYNTTSKVFQVYNGTDWEEVKNTGNFFISTLSPAFNGSVQDFTITNPPSYAAQILLSINGVVQKPNTGTSTPSEGFALSGSTIKLAAAPAAGSTYHAVVMGEAVNIGSPSENTVNTASLQNSAVTTDKIANDAVTPAKLSIMDNTNVAGTAGKLRLNPEDASTTWQRENKHMHQIRDDVYVESTINVGDKAGFDFTPLAISAFSYSGTTLTLTTATHAIAVGDNILIKDSASGFQEAFNTISGTTGTTVKVTRSSDPSSSLSTANTKVILYTPADPRGCINVAKDHDKFDQNTFNPILRGYVGKDLDTATGRNTEAFKIEIKKDSSAADHVATLLHSTQEFGNGQRLALTIDDGNSYPDGKNLVLTQNGVKITADDSAFTDSDELLEVEGNAKIDGDLTATGQITASGNGITVSGSTASLSLTDDGDDPDYKLQNNNGQFRIFDSTNTANRFSINSSGVVDIAGRLDANGGAVVTGNLGVGTSSPSDLIHAKNSSVTNTKIVVESTGTNSYPAFRIKNDARAYDLGIDGATDAFRIYDVTGTTEKLKIDSSGVDITGTLKVNGSTISTGGLGNVVEDTTPQLGGDLQSNGNDIDFADNDKAVFGTGGDLSIYHDGSDNYIDGNSAAEDHLYIRANVGSDHSSNIHLQAKSGEDSIVCRDDEQVELYHNGNLKFATSLTGTTTTGIAVVKHTSSSGNDPILEVLHSNDSQGVKIGYNTIASSGSNSNVDLRLESKGTGQIYLIDNVQANGNIAVSGTVDGRDVASDGSKLDGIESGATADQTASEILTLIKTVDGNGSGLDADTLDGVSAGGFLSSDNADTASGDITFSGGAGAVTIDGNSDIRFNNGNWTGESCKIQRHGDSLYIQGGGATNEIILRSSGGTDRWRMEADGDLIPNNNTSGLGNSSNGLSHIFMAGSIYLGGTGSSNEINDYETGSWTPQLRGGSYEAGGYAIQVGSYTKIGRQVTVNFAIEITSKGSMSGNLHIVNLPFGVGSNLSGTSIEASGIAGYWSHVNPNSSHITCVADDADAIYLRHTVGAEDNPDQMVVNTSDPFNDIDSDFTIRGSVTYFV